MELDILHILSSKNNYDKYSYLIKDYMFSKEFNTIFKDMEDYYNTFDSITNIDWSNFYTWFKIKKHYTFKKEQIEIYNELIDKLNTHEVDSTTEELILKTLIDRDYAARIRSMSLDIETEESSEYDILDIDTLVNNYKEEIKRFDSSEEELHIDVLKLVEKSKSVKRYYWPINNLTESVGPVGKGNFIIIGARPDSGKTTFLCHAATFFASQFELEKDEVILWLNNEEDGDIVKKRLISSAIGWTEEEIDTDPLGAKTKLDFAMKPKAIKLVDEKVISTKYAEQLCKKYKPTVIIFDQLWKVTGFNREANTETERQTLLFAWARGLAKEYGPVLAVHQLGGDAEGEKWPTMRSLYGSQTGIQGEADAIINIGRSGDPSERMYRFFNIPKNKLGRGSECKAELRNARFFLKIKPEVARFEDVGEYAIS